MSWERLRTIVKDTGDRRLIVTGNDVGLFSYVVERFFGPAEEDEGQWPDGFWAPESQGGYYQTADDAERGARQDVDWLRKRNSS
jgi:hypothetical protein